MYGNNFRKVTLQIISWPNWTQVQLNSFKFEDIAFKSVKKVTFYMAWVPGNNMLKEVARAAPSATHKTQTWSRDYARPAQPLSESLAPSSSDAAPTKVQDIFTNLAYFDVPYFLTHTINFRKVNRSPNPTRHYLSNATLVGQVPCLHQKWDISGKHDFFDFWRPTATYLSSKCNVLHRFWRFGTKTCLAIFNSILP